MYSALNSRTGWGLRDANNEIDGWTRTCSLRFPRFVYGTLPKLPVLVYERKGLLSLLKRDRGIHQGAYDRHGWFRLVEA